MVSPSRSRKQFYFYENLLRRPESLPADTYHQVAEEFSSLKTYFVTFRKPRKSPRSNQSLWIVVDIVVPASSRKSARTQAEAIAKEELEGFVYVGVN